MTTPPLLGAAEDTESRRCAIPFGPSFLSFFVVAVLGLSLNEAAYATVDRGQLAAAAALGLPKWRQFRRVILTSTLSVVQHYVERYGREPARADRGDHQTRRRPGETAGRRDQLPDHARPVRPLAGGVRPARRGRPRPRSTRPVCR